MRTLLITYVLVLLVTSPCDMASADDFGTRLLIQPAVSKDNIAFVYDHDLWIADRSGQNPRRLTSHEGTEAVPQFSPDGQTVAFSAEFEGNLDVYAVSIMGGRPKRLTWHPAPDYVEGFTPDGKAVLFSSTRNLFTNRYRKLFTVSLEGGMPIQLPIPNGMRAAYSPDGKKIAYIPVGERFAQWKNYRGGTTTRIWIYDVADHSVQQVRQIEGRCNDTDPCWIDGKVYFRSDRNGEFNLYSFDPAGEAVTQLTHFDDFPIERLRGSSDTLIFEQAGLLHLFDLAASKSTQLRIQLASDLKDTLPRWVSGANWIRSGDISPTGARAVLEFRGEIVTVPAKKGDPRNITHSTAVHERSPAWSPDGTKIAYFSDQDGEYKLHIASQDGSADVSVYEIEGHGFFEDPEWSPDGTKISYADNSWSLYVFDIAKKTSTKIGSAVHYGPRSLRPLNHNWSPDSRWIAYTLNTEALMQQVYVYDVVEDKSYPISDGMSEAREPVFDRSGKYLFFTSSTDAGPVKHWFAMSNADMELSNAIFVAVLPGDIPSPIAPESDEENADKDKDKDKEAKDGKPAHDTVEKSAESKSDKPDSKDNGDKADGSKKPEKVRIDFDGLDQRILDLDLPSAVYSNLVAGPDETIYFIKTDRDSQSELVSYSLKKRESTTLLSDASGFAMSHDGKKILYVADNVWGIAPAGEKIDVSNTKLNLDQIKVHIDPPAEWSQIFEEAWRINRDFFYDPNMHGADWQAMRLKYKPLIEQAVTRDDVNRIIQWMCSELSVGHHGVGGGDQRITAASVPGGLLGADYVLENGRYRLAKVYGGLNWNLQLRAPLTEPGVSVKTGEYLLAVDGIELTDKDNVFRLFENTAGKQVPIKVGPNPDGSGARIVTVVPISDEGELRNRDWVEGNLRKVTEATGGRVAYVYVPNTTDAGHSYFKRYFFPQVDRQAIIIDERFNGGGQVADYYINLLNRPYISHWATRYGKDFRTPTGAIFGPRVMLIDETAGSGGDLLPWMFHKLEMGTLVGKRTWGGLVGILGFPTFIDGGSVTAPNLAFWTEDGFLVENVGVPPDVEVEQWPADVIAGHDPQLEKAIEIVLKQLESNPPHTFQKPPYPIRVRK